MVTYINDDDPIYRSYSRPGIATNAQLKIHGHETLLASL